MVPAGRRGDQWSRVLVAVGQDDRGLVRVRGAGAVDQAAADEQARADAGGAARVEPGAGQRRAQPGRCHRHWQQHVGLVVEAGDADLVVVVHQAVQHAHRTLEQLALGLPAVGDVGHTARAVEHQHDRAVAGDDVAGDQLDVEGADREWIVRVGGVVALLVDDVGLDVDGADLHVGADRVEAHLDLHDLEVVGLLRRDVKVRPAEDREVAGWAGP